MKIESSHEGGGEKKYTEISKMRSSILFLIVHG